jgi:hypothetical protein
MKDDQELAALKKNYPLPFQDATKRPGPEKLAILRRIENGCGMRIFEAGASLSILWFWSPDVGPLLGIGRSNQAGTGLSRVRTGSSPAGVAYRAIAGRISGSPGRALDGFTNKFVPHSLGSGPKPSSSDRSVICWPGKLRVRKEQHLAGHTAWRPSSRGRVSVTGKEAVP